MTEVESRTQGLRPRKQKNSEAKVKDRPLEAKAKNTGTSVLRKKKVFKKLFQAISRKKNVFQKIFPALHKILTIQKILLSSSRGQANFRGLEASRPRLKPRTSKSALEDVLEAKDVLEDSTSVE